MQLNLSGFAQPRFGYVPDDNEVEIKGDVGFSVRRVRLETKVNMLAPKALSLNSKVSIELMLRPDWWMPIST